MSQGRTAVSFTGVSLGKNTRLRTVSRLRVSGLEQSHRPGGLMAPAAWSLSCVTGWGSAGLACRSGQEEAGRGLGLPGSHKGDVQAGFTVSKN